MHFSCKSLSNLGGNYWSEHGPEYKQESYYSENVGGGVGVGGDCGAL